MFCRWPVPVGRLAKAQIGLQISQIPDAYWWSDFFHLFTLTLVTSRNEAHVIKAHMSLILIWIEDDF